MLLEGYLAKKKTYPKDEIQIVVTRVTGSILSPSWYLLNLIKERKITWNEYTIMFIHEMENNPEAIKEMRRIKELARTKNVRLICYEKQYPCHRFLLLKMIEELE